MAFDTFMTIPGIPGESQVEGFRNAIEVYSFSWGLSNPATLSGYGFNSSKTSFAELTIAKRFDKSSPKLMQALVAGQRLQSLTLALVIAGPNSGNKPFLTYQFTPVLVTTCSDSGSGGGDGYPTESLSFAAARATVTYYPQNPNGSPSNPVQFSFDQLTIS